MTWTSEWTVARQRRVIAVLKDRRMPNWTDSCQACHALTPTPNPPFR